MIQREISYAPGLQKIFDEILVNTADCLFFPGYQVFFSISGSCVRNIFCVQLVLFSHPTTLEKFVLKISLKEIGWKGQKKGAKEVR
jgi:hypothetical protein